MKFPLVTIALLCLAACGEQTRSAASTKAEAAPPAGWPVVDNGIPAAFQGVWAATEADCRPRAETRLEITADHLRFYESSGPVASVEATGPDEIRIAVSLTGEGAAAQRTFRYRLIKGGGVLFDVRNGLERVRCPTA